MLSCAEPLLQEPVSRLARSNAKLFVRTFMLATLSSVVLWGQLGGKEEHPVMSEPAAMASVRQRSVPQPMPLARPWQRTPLTTWSRKYLQPVRALGVASTQEDLNEQFLKQKALQEKLGSLAKFDVKALRAISQNGANVPEGTRGFLESELLIWENEQFTTTAACKRGVDYQIAKRTDAEAEAPPGITATLTAMLGKEVSDADMQKASTDLSGMQEGDLVIVQGSDSRWTYAMAVERSGISRSKTGVGLSLKLEVKKGVTKNIPYGEWDQIKQLEKPNPEAGIMERFRGNRRATIQDSAEAPSSKWAALAANPLRLKIGDECSEEELAKASADLSSVLTGDVVAVLRSSGKWTYASFVESIGDGFGQEQFAPGTGWLLRVDKEGSKKKVLSSQLADTVKAIKN